MNALELAGLVERLGELAAVGGDFSSPTVSDVPRWLLVRAAEAIEELIAERRERVGGGTGLPALDGPCPECEGSGCGECEGSGVLLTPAGAQILGFLHRAGWRR